MCWWLPLPVALSTTARDWVTALHPTLVTRAHVAHAQWTAWAVRRAMGGASESLSHTSGAWPTLPPVCARPKVLG